ncbi:hypothetical protein [Thioalkalivibrio sp. ALMg11]|uniref:hypothetical protein n=1 Tax=Thioalkalivibrio sp. ALMg11 TaxID=1158165 RepID=UPI00037113D3|nr:hypothetical protein [Thioalkalivibrio sp. ALMg11]
MAGFDETNVMALLDNVTGLDEDTANVLGQVENMLSRVAFECHEMLSKIEREGIQQSEGGELALALEILRKMKDYRR